MKKKVFICLSIAIAISGLVMAVSCTKINCPTSEYPYWCAGYGKCCSYKYYNGHGLCFESLKDCQATGYSCTTCYL